MFGSIFRRAQATVDNAISQFVYAVIVAVPLLIATGFGTAALLRHLDREFGTDTAYLILAGVFAMMSLIAMLVLNIRPRSVAAAAEPVADEASDASTADQLGAMSSSDRELLMSALTTAGPYALPGLLRIVMRNLPLILAVLAAVFVMTRPAGASDTEAGLQPGMEPAE